MLKTQGPYKKLGFTSPTQALCTSTVCERLAGQVGQMVRPRRQKKVDGKQRGVAFLVNPEQCHPKAMTSLRIKFYPDMYGTFEKKSEKKIINRFAGILRAEAP
ncbi:hypothetical protein HYV43_05725 [Candidatus Micrarchaeota archaeon]|nr:hypothetical protein [Candidatus Micrarchaeota archaeon]